MPSATARGQAPAEDAADLSTLDALELDTATLEEPAPAQVVAAPAPGEEVQERLGDLETSVSNLGAALSRIEGLLSSRASTDLAPDHYQRVSATTPQRKSSPAPTPAPRQAAKPDPRNLTIATAVLVAHQAGLHAGRWRDARAVNSILAERIVAPLFDLHAWSEKTADDPSTVYPDGKSPCGSSGAPIDMARVVVGCFEVAGAFGIDLPKAIALVLGL